MLEIKVPLGVDRWDEEKEEFILPDYKRIRLEHSLVSLSKWESKWCKPFLSTSDKTIEETIDYIRCMTTTQNVDPNIYTFLSKENIRDIYEYIESPMTATKFNNVERGRLNGEVITAEILYYYMIFFNIPFECQKWHLNRLVTLIRVCSIKNGSPKKMSKTDVAARNRALNEARKQKYNTRG